MTQQHGFLPAQGLTTEQLTQIRALAELCDKTDNIKIKMLWHRMEARPDTEINDWLYYENGELAGCLSMFIHTQAEAEFSGMVHPDYRRRGIFTQLVDGAKAECASRGIPKLLFMNQKGSLSGKMFLEQLGATYTITEYWMNYDRAADQDAVQTRTLPGTLTLREAAPDTDFETLVRLDVLGFDIPEEAARDYVANRSDDRVTLMAEIEGKSEGKISYNVHDGLAFIFGFCMMPDVRGQGYGRRVLSETIRRIQAETQEAAISLEVAAENDRALSLYESCGFRTDNANEYYAFLLPDR